MNDQKRFTFLINLFSASKNAEYKVSFVGLKYAISHRSPHGKSCVEQNYTCVSVFQVCPHHPVLVSCVTPLLNY